VRGLPVGSKVWFRCRVGTKDGAGNWTQPMWLLVV
jgi:hypothetical protein